MATLRPSARAGASAQCRRASATDRRLGSVHIDPYIVLGSAIIGLLVGMTGAGGGALMTPMLILLFGVTPSTAISIRPGRRGGHAPDRRRGAHPRGNGQLQARALDGGGVGARRLPGRLSAPSARGRQIGGGHHRGVPGRRAADRRGRHGAALRASTAARARAATCSSATSSLRPLPTLAIGIIGGVIVGMTSVGLRVTDDRRAAVHLSAYRGQPAGRDRPHAGGAADRGRRARSAGLRAHRARR